MADPDPNLRVAEAIELADMCLSLDAAIAAGKGVTHA
jgi:hypothetical protein